MNDTIIFSVSSPMSMKSMKQESPQTPAPEAPMSFYNPAAVQQTQQEQMSETNYFHP